jgi:hypothetical protein
MQKVTQGFSQSWRHVQQVYKCGGFGGRVSLNQAAYDSSVVISTFRRPEESNANS